MPLERLLAYNRTHHSMQRLPPTVYRTCTAALLYCAGLTLNDAVYLRVFLVYDPFIGAVDYQGWFNAYALYFNIPGPYTLCAVPPVPPASHYPAV